MADRRDQKGLYEQAPRGDLKNFTGIDSAYDPPDAPEIRIDSIRLSAEAIIESLSMSM
ncbi:MULTISPECIES: adenylyl-sulfate kinase [unclassified Thiocapsa]|uniref:adenylyl-sulfate kinase n=1 Tax=unclassified Thiocapsa TaxID=2641286 RepID=UPI0035B47807